FDEHGGGVYAGRPALVADRVDDHVQVAAPVAVSGDQNLRAAGPVGQHRGVGGVFVNNVLPAVDHAQVGLAQDLIGGGVVGGQQHDLVVAESAGAQGADQPVGGQWFAA